MLIIINTWCKWFFLLPHMLKYATSQRSSPQPLATKSSEISAPQQIPVPFSRWPSVHMFGLRQQQCLSGWPCRILAVSMGQPHLPLPWHQPGRKQGLQVPLQDILQQPGPPLLEFPSDNLANSQVGSAGTTHLSKAQWRCINKIELSIRQAIQAATLYELTEPRSSAESTGPSWPASRWVTSQWFSWQQDDLSRSAPVDAAPHRYGGSQLG